MGYKLRNKELDSKEYAAALIDMIENRQQRGLAKAITEIENGGECKRTLLQYSYQKDKTSALVVGITGAGGVGKSTLTDKLLKEYRSRGKTVGVLAVDPSSPFSGGAFLGDRVRMGVHNMDTDVFIRSFGSRSSQGGISEGAKEALYLYKAFGFDVILLESLGVGQDETEINMFVDVNMLVLVPGLGDIMQMFKAGVREVANMFLINKSDKPEAAIVKEMLENSFGIMPPELRPPIMSTIASQDVGVKEVVDTIYKEAKKQNQFADRKRALRIRAEITASAMQLIRPIFEKDVNQAVDQVTSGELSPFEASDQIVEHMESMLAEQ